MIDFLGHLRQQLTDDRDLALIGQAEVLVASGYENVLPEVHRILMSTSLSASRGYAEDVNQAISIAAAATLPTGTPNESIVLSAFRRDLLDRKKEAVSGTLKDLKAGGQ